MEGHSDTKQGHIGAQSFADSSKLPKGAQRPGLPAVQERRPQRPDVGAGANQQQDHCQQGRKVEQGRHDGIIYSLFESPIHHVNFDLPMFTFCTEVPDWVKSVPPIAENGHICYACLFDCLSCTSIFKLGILSVMSWAPKLSWIWAAKVIAILAMLVNSIYFQEWGTNMSGFTHNFQSTWQGFVTDGN